MKYNEGFIKQFLVYEAKLRKKVKYNKRFKEQACPVCGCRDIDCTGSMAEYPEVWSIDSCANCGCVVCYEDNCLPQYIWDELKHVRSKKKVLAIVQKFYYGSNKKIKKIL